MCLCKLSLIDCQPIDLPDIHQHVSSESIGRDRKQPCRYLM